MMAMAGVEVLSDDLVVLDGTEVFAGPRCVDLRADAARHLAIGRDLGVVGRRERWRVDLGRCAAAVPLAGFLYLAWGTETSLHRLDLPERLAGLLRNRAVQVPVGDRAGLMELASLPALSWCRPKSWNESASGLKSMLERITS
jgi:hypothetical protein